jgi:hypothetical protein
MIQTKTEAQLALKDALVQELDGLLGAHAFERGPRSLKYIRRHGAAVQEVEFCFQYRPRYEPGAAAHVLPWVAIKISEVSQIALAMVQVPALLSGTPLFVLRQPLDIVIPKHLHARWFFSDEPTARHAIRSIRESLAAFGVPFLDSLASSSGLVRAFETADDRVLKQQHWYIYVAAAYIVLGSVDKARAVLNDKLGNMVARQRFATAFDYVERL